jgi:hypothetical protein
MSLPEKFSLLFLFPFNIHIRPKTAGRITFIKSIIPDTPKAIAAAWGADDDAVSSLFRKREKDNSLTPIFATKKGIKSIKAYDCPAIIQFLIKLPLPNIPRRTAVCKIKKSCDRAEKKTRCMEGNVWSLDSNNFAISKRGLSAFISGIFPQIIRRTGPAKQKSRNEITRRISK